jgi:Ca2+-binding EF-hand superfamily protein
MSLSALIVPLLAALVQAGEPPVTIVGHAWAPFISPMGEPFRARSMSDDTLALWFRQADRNQDGMLTPDEMQADAERFFTKLDGNHDGEIDPEELMAYESEVAPEIQVNSRWRRSRGQAAAVDGHDGYQVDGLQGAARYALLNLPEPVAGADADFNRAITLVEFRQAAAYRFRLLDGDRQGQLTLAKLKALLPPPPKAGRRAKRGKNAVDTRVGLPLPEGD